MIKGQTSGYEIEKQIKHLKVSPPKKPFSGKEFLRKYKKYQSLAEIF